MVKNRHTRIIRSSPTCCRLDKRMIKNFAHTFHEIQQENKSSCLFFPCLSLPILTYPILPYPSPLVEMAKKRMLIDDYEETVNSTWQKRRSKMRGRHTQDTPGKSTGITTLPSARGDHQGPKGPVLTQTRTNHIPNTTGLQQSWATRIIVEKSKL